MHCYPTGPSEIGSEGVVMDFPSSALLALNIKLIEK